MLSGNMLKILAALSMLLDHTGVILFPRVGVLRILGRVAFPIYAYMLAEGCERTHNKLRYFLSVFLLGLACQIVYYFYDGGQILGILLTLSCGILLIYALQRLKSVWFTPDCSLGERFAGTAVFLLALVMLLLLNHSASLDYGLWGCLLPVWPSLLRRGGTHPPQWLTRLDRRPVHILLLGLLPLARIYGGVQIYALAAIPLLLLYSGKRGKWKMKSFFYIFYPAHMAILALLQQVLSWYK